MTITYAPRVTVHPDRYGANRSAQKPMVKWLILHTSEQSGAEDVNDAEDLAAFMRRPGDRPGSSGPFGASYHGVTDTNRIIPCTEDHLVAYAAGGANQYGLHLCIPVRINPRNLGDLDANYTRDQWLDAGSRPYIRQAAEWIVDKARAHNIPLHRITELEMAAGRSGFCDHWTASKAFKKSDHTDVGLAFPWDVLWSDIIAIVNPPQPPEEDEMINAAILRLKDATGFFDDQVVALTIANPEQHANLAPTRPPVTVTIDAAGKAEIEAQLGFKLTRTK
jgi:hypothetical protein